MYKVINIFQDKYTGKIYQIGDNFVSDEPERIEDLIVRKLIEGVPDGASSVITKKKGSSKNKGK